MLSYQEVILRLLYYLSRITAILEFSYDSKKQIFLKSRFGNCCVWKWLWLSTGPIGVYTLLSLSAFAFNKKRDAMSDIIHIEYLIYGFIFFISTWNFLCSRDRLFKLLNNFLRIAKMHHLIFGKTLKVSRVHFLLQFIHGIWLWTSLALPDNWFVYSICIQNIRFMLQVYLADIAMLLHFQLVNTFARNLRLFPPIQQATRELYIEYAAQLINLRKMLQKFLWPFYILRFGLEIGMSLSTLLEFYYTPLIGILYIIAIQTLCSVNGIRMLKIASSIYQMESQIVGILYDWELLDYLIELKPERNMNLLKVSFGLLCKYIILTNSFIFTVGESSSKTLHYRAENRYTRQLYLYKTFSKFEMSRFHNPKFVVCIGF